MASGRNCICTGYYKLESGVSSTVGNVLCRDMDIGFDSIASESVSQ